MTANAATSSTFASLLKQSKFASYSPSIAQVYTTYGGHASRGDWGVKRPLSARKRNRALLIQSIDSREQQTEFRSGEPEAKMVQRWEETGKDVAPSLRFTNATSWNAQYANRPRGELPIDSEFSAYTDNPDPLAGPAGANPALRVKTPPSIEAIPNPYLMSEREFNRYLERVRTFRPAFRKYIRAQEIAEAKRVGRDIPDLLESPPNLYRMRRERRAESVTTSFLNEMAYQLHGAPDSQALEPYPHRNGGLYYPSPNSFQTALLHPPIPAHFTSVDSDGTNVSAAGMNVKVTPVDNEGIAPVEWNGESTRVGRAPVRFSSAELIRAPETVVTSRTLSLNQSFSAPAASVLRHRNRDLTTPPFTYPSGIKDMKLDISGVTIKDVHPHSNPHRPGSLGYSLSPPPPGMKSRGKVGPQAPRLKTLTLGLDSNLGTTFKNRSSGQNSLLNNLDRLLNRMDDKKKGK
ncbi:hypothetical protein CPB86DRAFT_783453 [Serendipita vermifera]|nr:hypothetical protein CPB86DRAFT_783453 [Serendipita vermifera]